MLARARAGDLSRGCPGNSAHQGICRLHCGKNGDAVNDPCSKLVEPVQDIQSFLQHIPGGNCVAGLVEEDQPSGQKLCGFHMIKFVPVGGLTGEALTSMSVVTPGLDMATAIRPVTVVADGMGTPVGMSAFPSMEALQPERFAEEPDVVGA